jgi:hypothetical protein
VKCEEGDDMIDDDGVLHPDWGDEGDLIKAGAWDTGGKAGWWTTPPICGRACS